MSAREVIARRRCQGELNATYPCRRLCGACLSWADADLAALREAGHVVVPVVKLRHVIQSDECCHDTICADMAGDNCNCGRRLRAMLAAAAEDQR